MDKVTLISKWVFAQPRAFCDALIIGNMRLLFQFDAILLLVNDPRKAFYKANLKLLLPAINELS